MSLENDVKNVKILVDAFAGLQGVRSALESALAAEGAAKAAEKRLASAEMALADAAARLDAMNAAVVTAKDEASKLVLDARKYASEIKNEAKVKSDKKLAEADAKALKLEQEVAINAEKFTAMKSAQEETLGMLGAQIAHGEAKLSEIREAIAKATKL